MSDVTRTFVLRPLGGWGARFAMIGAAHVFAQKHGRTLRLWWSAQEYTRYWPAWNDVFATPANLVSAAEMHTLQLPDRDVLDAWTDAQGASDVPLLAAHTAWYPRGTLPKEVAFAAFAKTFTFRADVRAAAYADRLPPGTIGVHVRRTDHKAATRISSLEHFIAAMHLLGRERPYFVCSDDATVTAALLAQFPNAFTSKLSCTRDTLPGILHGLVTMLTLSRCQLIIGSARSSFSHFSAIYGNIPLWIAGQSPLEVLKGLAG